MIAVRVTARPLGDDDMIDPMDAEGDVTGEYAIKVVDSSWGQQVQHWIKTDTGAIRQVDGSTVRPE